MNTERLDRLTKSLEASSFPQMLVSDPVGIYYLTGLEIWPGERFLGLYLNREGVRVLVVNDLFPLAFKPACEVVYYNDIEDGPAKLLPYMDKNAPLGVDKVMPAGFLLSLMEKGAASEYLNGSILLDRQRQIKEPEEQQKMQESARICDAVMVDFQKICNQGQSEEQLDREVRRLFKEHGAEGLSFDPITSYGVNGADPHHGPDGTLPKKGDSLVIDIGGRKDGYCSDMTRTVFLGEVSDLQREVYEIVREANLRGIAAAKPGNRMMDVDLAARNYIEEKGYGEYFTHRTGHSIGLEDHEYGDVSSVNGDVIRVGQCFSVEPGIYLEEEGFGVRIEDIVLITEDGCEVLNKVPKDLKVLPFD